MQHHDVWNDASGRHQAALTPVQAQALSRQRPGSASGLVSSRSAQLGTAGHTQILMGPLVTANLVLTRENSASEHVHAGAELLAAHEHAEPSRRRERWGAGGESRANVRDQSAMDKTAQEEAQRAAYDDHVERANHGRCVAPAFVWIAGRWNTKDWPSICCTGFCRASKWQLHHTS